MITTAKKLSQRAVARAWARAPRNLEQFGQGGRARPRNLRTDEREQCCATVYC